MIGFALPPVNTIAKFSFTGEFSTLNNIYKVTKISSFEQMQNDGVDLEALLYNLAGVDYDQYTSHYTTFANRPVLYLSRVNDDALDLVVPEVLLQHVPDQDILTVYDLFLGIDLGVFVDHTKLQWLVNHVEDVVSSATGVLKNSTLISNETRYVARVDYDALDAERIARVNMVESLTITNQKNLDLIGKQQTYISALEQQILDLTNA